MVRQPSRVGFFIRATGVEDERSTCFQLPNVSGKKSAMSFLLNGKWTLSGFPRRSDRETRGIKPLMVLQIQSGPQSAFR